MPRSFDIQPPAPHVARPQPATPRPEPAGPASPEQVATVARRSARHERRGPFGVVVVALIVVLGATVGGLYVFNSFGGNGAGVEVSIAGPSGVTSGDEVEYRISVRNRQVALQSADLTLEYPAGFVPEHTEPAAANEGQSFFSLGPLQPGQRLDVTVRGPLVGPAGSRPELRARVSYRPVDFNSDFNAEAAAVTPIVGSRLKLTATAPREVAVGGSLTVAVQVENTSDRALGELEVVIEQPRSFTLTSATPPLTGGEAASRWELGTLSPGGAWSGQASGDVVGEAGQQASFAVAVYQRTNGRPRLLDQRLVEVRVVQPQVELSLTANGQSGEATVPDGSSVAFAVSYRGVGETPLTNLTLRLRLEGQGVGWEAIEDPYGGRREGQALVWDRTSPGNGQLLTRIERGSEGAFVVRVPLHRDGSDAVTAVATLESESFGPDYRAVAGPVTVRIGGALEVRRSAELVAGEAAPRVGQPTDYTVTWTLGAVEPLTDVSFSAEVAEGVSVGSGEATAGDFSVDGRRVRWNVPTISSGSALVTWTATLTPPASAAGSVAAIVGPVTVTATVGGQNITRQLDLLTTGLDGRGDVVGE